jgi:hypothetical protein
MCGLAIKELEVSEVKIFKMNDCDWVAARTLEEAKKCLAEIVSDGVVNEDFEKNYLDDPRELGASALDTLRLGDEDEMNKAISERESDTTGNEWEKRLKVYNDNLPTFREALAQRLTKEKPPFFFATSEY